jgi:hypothetical protein
VLLLVNPIYCKAPSFQEAKANHLREFGLGRSDFDNSGLIKNRWGAKSSLLECVRFSAPGFAHRSENRGLHVAKHVFACLPDGLLTKLGSCILGILAAFSLWNSETSHPQGA